MQPLVSVKSRSSRTRRSLRAGRSWVSITQLIDDGTYFVVEQDGLVAGCGGWSRRATLYGGDRSPGRDAAPLDLAKDAARSSRRSLSVLGPAGPSTKNHYDRQSQAAEAPHFRMGLLDWLMPVSVPLSRTSLRRRDGSIASLFLSGEAVERGHVNRPEAIQYLTGFGIWRAVDDDTGYGREGNEALRKLRERLLDMRHDRVGVTVSLEDVDSAFIIADVVFVR